MAAVAESPKVDAVAASVAQMAVQQQQQPQPEPESPHNGQACDNTPLEQSWNDLNSTLLEQLKALNVSQTPHMKRRAEMINRSSNGDNDFENSSNVQQKFDAFDDHNGFENTSHVSINEFEKSQVQETSVVVQGLENSGEGCTNGSGLQQQADSGEVVKGMMNSSGEVRKGSQRGNSFVSRLPRPTKGRLKKADPKRRPSYVLPPVYKAAADPTPQPTVVRCFVSRLPQPQPVKYSTPCETIEEGHDSGVDESTQAKENGGPSRSTSKGSKGSPRKRVSRSTDPSPMKGRSPQSTASSERKIPMNKVQVGTTASPNLKSVRSKIGSLDNASHKAGGGKVKIESKKIDFTKQAASRITAKNESYTPGGGEKKIESKKLNWKAESKVGSMDNKSHKAGGGDKKIESRKIEIKAKSKVGSKDNIKHKAGGGEVQIESKKLEFKDKASSKVGSLKNVKHKAGGGEGKIFDDKEYIRQCSSPAKTPSKTTSRATSRASSESGRISPGGVMSPGSPHEEEEDQVVQVTVSQGVTPSEE